eukprot:SAG31_NODE_11834_length_991_cov_3.252796_1_plen_145_part_01
MVLRVGCMVGGLVVQKKGFWQPCSRRLDAQFVAERVVETYRMLRKGALVWRRRSRPPARPLVCSECKAGRSVVLGSVFSFDSRGLRRRSCRWRATVGIVAEMKKWVVRWECGWCQRADRGEMVVTGRSTDQRLRARVLGPDRCDA